MIAPQQYEIDMTVAFDGAFVTPIGARLGDTKEKKR
jgi:hypothetical protein